MTHYFFDTADGDEDVDDVGVDLPGDDDALLEAVRFAGSLIADQPSLLAHGSDLVVTARAAARITGRVRISLSH